MNSLTGLSLDLLGVPVHIQCDDTEAAARIELCYARSTETHGGPISPGVRPVTAQLTRDAHSWRVEIHGSPNRSHHSQDGNVVPPSSVAVVHGDDGDRRAPDGATCVHGEGDLVDAVGALNHELLHAVMRRRPQLFYVHAGVIEHEGRAIVLPGLSRAGKSTLVLAFLQAGARFLSDELLAFDRVTGNCHAFPRAVKIRDMCVPYFPDWQDRFVGHGEGRFLPFDVLGDDVLADPCPVAAVVMPRWSDEGPNELTSLTRGRALLELSQSALNFGTHRTQSVEHLADIVRDAAAFQLRWREPHEAVRQILDALRSEG